MNAFVRAVRLVAGATRQHELQWAAIESVGAKIGALSETGRKWVRLAEVDAGQRPGMTISASPSRINS